MSERWPGGIVRSTPVTPTGPLQNGTAPGIWTMEQAAYWTKQGLWPTAGNFLAVEDVFSTYLYTGNGSTQTITNGIDLAGKGGLVWIKARSSAQNNVLADTANGTSLFLSSNTTSGQTGGSVVTAFSSTGFNTGGNTTLVAGNGVTYASWTFREAPKFFDVVTWTGNGSSGRTISHNLGVAPGCIIVKRTDTTSNWPVYQRAVGATKYLFLNAIQAAGTSNAFWNDTEPTSSVFTVGSDATVNANGGTYVAYLYAHDTASDGIIQCGSFTAGVSTGTASVTLGWEPQWLLIKGSNATAVSDAGGYWSIMDNMRGMDAANNAVQLQAESSAAESTNSQQIRINSTGFTAGNMAGSSQYIYIAIRRGPMRTPTLGTSVFSPIANTGNSTAKTLTTNFVTDLTVSQGRNAGSGSRATWWDRLRGPLLGLQSVNITAETSYTATLTGFDNNTGVAVGADGTYGYINLSPDTFATWHFRRAPSFFDVVCYTGTGAGARTLNHNLTVAPELMILKTRSSDPGYEDWFVYSKDIPSTSNLTLNSNVASGSVTNVINTPTASTFGVLTFGNRSNINYVSYLFASCPGVSKVGSYTGTGALQTINCGFTTGARFVLIKRTDSTGDWFVWDSARGITSGNDPYLLWNSNAAEVTGTNYVDTDTTGFKVTAAAPAGINANGGSYIFLAVA